MKVNRLPENAIVATLAMLGPHVPELSAQNLLLALREFDPHRKEKATTVWLSKHEAADALGVSWFTLVRWAKTGKIPAKKFGDSWRFDSATIRGEG